MRTREKRAMEEGRQARRAGQAEDDCPYTCGGYGMGNAWKDGWNEADRLLVSGSVCTSCGKRFTQRPGGSQLVTEAAVHCVSCGPPAPDAVELRRMRCGCYLGETVLIDPRAASGCSKHGEVPVERKKVPQTA